MLKHHINSIMWTFSMAKTKEVPHTSASTYDMRVMANKIPKDLILELGSTPT
jgi:hypothetical protein